MEYFTPRESERSMDIEAGYKKASRLMESQSLKPEDFSEKHSREEIERDNKYVEKMEAIFKKDVEQSREMENAHKLATIFEAVIYERAERSEWMGPDAMTIKTSRFDDIVNGVDLVVELANREKEELSYLAMGVDATIQADIDKKLARIKEGIDNETLSRVKYFSSERDESITELSAAPSVIIVANGKTVEELNELWLSGTEKELANHQVKFQILEEMQIQLNAFVKYAEKNKKSDKILIPLRSLMNTVKNIYNESKASDKRDRDDTFYALESKLNRIFGK